MGGYLAERIDALREHLAALAAAFPGLATELGRMAEAHARERAVHGSGYVVGLIAGLLILGFAAEAAWRRWVRRPDAALLGFARELGALAAFALGSVVLFLGLRWPPIVRESVLDFVTAFLALRAVMMVSAALLVPAVVPMEEERARYWRVRIGLFAGWLAFGWVIVSWLDALGMDPASRKIIAYTLGLGLVAIAVEALRTPLRAAVVLALWLLWVAGARGAFWLVLLAVGLPWALGFAQRAADHALGGVRGAAVGRGVRVVLIVGAALLLARAFGVDLEALAAGDTLASRVTRGVIEALAVILVADFLWFVTKALIDGSLATAQSGATGDAAEDSRRARLRTLLPILRSTLLVVLLAMAVLMALAARGVQIAPLIAGAGVVGVAIGFGAQTLVRDLFAKFSYLMDDAFRVGEYIESGQYKGTFEHLGGRSIRLRHHRGPVFTIPYGQLGAVKNSSRDWVIDKMMIGLVYGTDLDKVKKVLKQIGKELSANPEFASDILEPLKMQGVEQFGDFAIKVRLKMKTLPNKQFGIRRRAYAMMQKAFAENGIQFAFPTVQVAGGAEGAAAAAASRALSAAPAQT